MATLTRLTRLITALLGDVCCAPDLLVCGHLLSWFSHWKGIAALTVQTTELQRDQKRFCLHIPHLGR